MKKRSPSSGQNGQLVHWWLLVHSGPSVPYHVLQFITLCKGRHSHHAWSSGVVVWRGQDEMKLFSSILLVIHFS
jgi:hypothetical protein